MVCEEEMKNQMAWIARGIAPLVNDLSYRNLIEQKMIKQNDFGVSNSLLQTSLPMTTDYENDVQQSINNYFPSNSYDQTYFFSFICDSCEWNTGVYSPNLDYPNVDIQSTLYVAPAAETQEGDSIIAYFYNSSIGLVDSLFVNEDFLDSNYVWIVTALNECDEDFFEGVGGDVKTKVGPCDPDGFCDRENGETEKNCDDCRTTPLPLNSKRLELLEYETLRDFKRPWRFRSGQPRSANFHQERWYKKQYKINFQYMITRSNGWNSGPPFLEMVTQFKRVPNGAPGSFSHDRYSVFGLNKIDFHGDDAEVARCRIKRSGGVQCNSGTNKTFKQDYLMCLVFDPTTDYVNYAMYEKDFTEPNSMWINTLDSLGEFRLQRIFIPETAETLDQQFKPGVSGKGTVYSQDDDCIIPPGSIWIKEDINGEEWYVHETITDGELRIKFGYKNNY